MLSLIFELPKRHGTILMKFLGCSKRYQLDLHVAVLRGGRVGAPSHVADCWSCDARHPFKFSLQCIPRKVEPKYDIVDGISSCGWEVEFGAALRSPWRVLRPATFILFPRRRSALSRTPAPTTAGRIDELQPPNRPRKRHEPRTCQGCRLPYTRNECRSCLCGLSGLIMSNMATHSW